MAVYFIHDETTDRVKIGHAIDPWHRFSKIQSDSPSVLAILAIIDGGSEREAEMHARFADLRVRGEWFAFGPALEDFVQRHPVPERPRNVKTRAFWNGMSAQEVADLTGIAKSTLSQIRTQGKRVRPETAIAIQRVCGVSAVKLVFGDLAEEAA